MKRILSLTVLTVLTITAMQAKNLDQNKINEIQEGIVELKTELPIKMSENSVLKDITFKNGIMTSHIVLNANFDEKRVNSEEFKEIVEREGHNLKVEACNLEISQELKIYDNFKVKYNYYKNSLDSKNIIAEFLITPSIDCN